MFASLLITKDIVKKTDKTKGKENHIGKVKVHEQIIFELHIQYRWSIGNCLPPVHMHNATCCCSLE